MSTPIPTPEALALARHAEALLNVLKGIRQLADAEGESSDEPSYERCDKIYDRADAAIKQAEAARGSSDADDRALLDFLDAEAARRGCDLSICEVRDENERIQWAGIEWGEETSVRAAIEELRQCARKGGGP